MAAIGPRGLPRDVNMPNNPPLPSHPLSAIPLIGPVYDLAGHLLGTFGAGGAFTRAAGNIEGKVASTAVSDIFHGINFGNWALRLGEIILGVVLIGVGVAKLTGADNVIMKAATAAGRIAV